MNENQTPQPQQSQQQAPKQEFSVDNDNLLAALCYGLVPPLAVAISIFLYIQKKNSPVIQFHAKQGMIVGFIFIVAMIIPYVGPILAYGVFPALAIIAGYKAYQGEQWEIPIISDISKQINL